jgi:hypothetical protein
MRTEADKAYLAGFLDGEGYIGISLLATPHGRGRHTLTVTITNTAIDTLRALAELWDARVMGVRQRAAHYSHVGDLRWTTDAAARVLREIQPYLRVKREQARIALEFAATLRSREHRTTPITPAEWEFRDQLRFQIQSLHSRKPGPARLASVLPTLTCTYCGATFNSYQKRRRYCSRDCSLKAARDAYENRAATQRLCDACGQTFFARPDQKFCSIECRARGRIGHKFPNGYKSRRVTTLPP